MGQDDRADARTRNEDDAGGINVYHLRLDRKGRALRNA